MKSQCFVSSSWLQKRFWPLDASFPLAVALLGPSALALECIAQDRGHNHSVLILLILMKDTQHIQIAGVHFHIQCQDAKISRHMDAAYGSFVGNQGASLNDIHIQIHLIIGNKPDIWGWKKIFDSGVSWAMFKNEGSYCISMKPEGFDQDIWLAVSKPGFTEVTIYCSEDMLNQDQGNGLLHNPVCYPLDQILLMYILSPNQGLLMHAAGAVFGGNKGFLFPGKSGAGKSTLAKQIIENHDESLLSDDRIIVRKHSDSFTAYGTPWPGEAGIAESRKTDVSAILFLKHETSCSIRQLNTRESSEKLFPIVSIPWYDQEVMLEIMGFCEEIISNIPCYELSFTPGPETVDFLNDFSETQFH
jgi:hypothetical protein